MNMFGERQDNKAFIPRIINKLLQNEVVQIHSKYIDGQWFPGVRSYLHAYNQADALVFIINNVVPKLYLNEMDKPEKFNIAGNYEASNLELVLLIANILGIKDKKVFEYVDSNIVRPGHDLKYSIDGSKLHKLGWEPPLKFYDSLNQTVNWSINNREWLSTLNIKW